ncbi:MAG: helix-turn-helix domain-containing protein [Mycolicibacterium frederiksbergense]|nr:helix-turn-helix domain-containing protein [Mycolicibacterium frederiksbergense]
MADVADVLADLSATVPEHLLPAVATPPQVAKVVQTTVDALAQDRYRGRGIPYVRVGRRIRYLRTDVLKYLEGNKIGAA